jgi:hypothetical protein
MLRITRIAQLTVRLCGVALIVLGVLIWTGDRQFIQAHMGLGVLLVLALWVLAALGVRARVASNLVIRAVIWGAVVLAYGIYQTRIWPGRLHVYVRVLHLVVGLIAMSVGELLAARIEATGVER